MSLFDFCKAHHNPRIFANKPSIDGQEVDNLISSNALKRKNGYFAETFISAPVEIVLSFPEAIELSHIVLGLGDERNRTTAFRLLTECEGSTKHSMMGFHAVGTYENVDSPKLCLVNRRVRRNRSLANFTPDVQLLPQRNLYPKCDSSVRYVKKLKILLTRTTKCPPILNEIQVWGHLSPGCSEQSRRKVLDAEMASYHKEIELKHDSEVETDVSPVCESNACQCENESIPSEFMDSITFEVMCHPMLLPSGQNIDISTLDKCVEASVRQGQYNCDPFTGILYGQNNQPVSNIELKSRIDNFWLHHPDLISGGRCLGCIKSTSNSNHLKVFPRKYRKNIEPYSTSVSTSNHTFRAALGQTKNTSVCRNSRTKVCSNKARSDHEKELASSLKFSLNEVLRGKNCYTIPSEASDCLKMQTACAVCDVRVKNHYLLPCLHKLCRSCVMNDRSLSSMSCRICGGSYNTSDVVCVRE